MAPTITGGPNADTLFSTAGDDVVDGGDGSDTLVFGVTSVTASLLTGIATGHGNDTFSNIENLTSGSGDDTLTGDGNANVLTGGNGKNTISGGGGNDTIVDGELVGSLASSSLLDGGDGTDRLILRRSSMTANAALSFDPGSNTTTFLEGTSFQNFEYLELTTGSGDDAVQFSGLLSGAGDPNGWNAGSGTDTVTLDLSNYAGGVTMSSDTVLTTDSAGLQIIRMTSVEVFSITGGAGNDILYGANGNDTLTGNGGNDALWGAGGTNTLSGGEGDDKLYDSGNASTLDGGNGIVSPGTTGDTFPIGKVAVTLAPSAASPHISYVD